MNAMDRPFAISDAQPQWGHQQEAQINTDVTATDEMTESKYGCNEVQNQFSQC